MSPLRKHAYVQFFVLLLALIAYISFCVIFLFVFPNLYFVSDFNIRLSSLVVETTVFISLMNSISNTPKLGIEENEKLMFLNYIDQFNEWHLKILSFLNSPESYFAAETRPNLFSGGKATILVSAFPELGDRRDFYDQVARDLKNRDLIAYDTLHNTMSETGLWQSGTTEVGKRFLEFISE